MENSKHKHYSIMPERAARNLNNLETSLTNLNVSGTILSDREAFLHRAQACVFLSYKTKCVSFCDGM